MKTFKIHEYILNNAMRKMQKCWNSQKFPNSRKFPYIRRYAWKSPEIQLSGKIIGITQSDTDKQTFIIITIQNAYQQGSAY